MTPTKIDKVDVDKILSRKLTYREQQQASRLSRALVFTSPGADSTRQPQIVRFTRHHLVLFQDGSVRNVPQRRRFGISGRQLRMKRKAQRRAMKREIAQATPPIVVD